MINEKIIGYLKRKFPDKSPDLTNSEKEIWYKAGQVSVVRHLEGILKDQENNVLNIQDLEEL